MRRVAYFLPTTRNAGDDLSAARISPTLTAEDSRFEVDPGQAIEQLVATLDSLPATPADPYWICREAAFADVVLQTDDPRAWQALARLAKRADVGLRMELIGGMTRREDRKKQQLAFLSAFLDDAEVRDVAANPKMFSGLYAASNFPNLTVRDFAAMDCNSSPHCPR